MREAPSTTYGGISIDPTSGLSKLLQLVVRRTRLSMFRGLDDRLFILGGEAVQRSAARAATHSSARKERSVDRAS